MIEDDIAAVMIEHENEAPTTEELLTGLRSRRRSHGWLYAAAAALLVVGVLSGVWAAGGGSHRAPHATGLHPASMSPAKVFAPLACPTKYAEEAPWVPANPKGISGNSRLVPTTTPKSVLMCAYKGSNSGGYSISHWVLAGKRHVTGNLTGMADELTWQPRKLPGEEYACTAMGGIQTNYLIGLTYSSGTMWVSASDEPNDCVSATNGEFTTLPGLGGDATKAFTTGRWPAPAPIDCDSAGGRLGQDTAMVPLGAVTLTICTDKPHVVKGDFGEIVSALNSLPTSVGNGSCSPTPKESYRLIFGYYQSPSVSISVMNGCYPEVYNGTLAGQKAGQVLSLIQDLLHRH